MGRMSRAAFVLFAGLSAGGAHAKSDDLPPVSLAPNVDTARYAGKWYIIANIPYFAERGNVASYFDVSFPENDKVIDVYSGRSSFAKRPSEFTLKGYIVPGTNNARWRESPFWPVYFSYLIVYVDPDYQTALVGYPGHNYAWVLARSPTLDDATYESLLNRFAAAGYDRSKIRKIPQVPTQVGQPGFQ
jgi:apolipoprotein D and lipocalin family protein